MPWNSETPHKSSTVWGRSMLAASDEVRVGVRSGALIVSGARIIPPKCIAPFMIKPWSPIMSPWSVVKITIVSSSAPTAATASRIWPTPLSIDSIIP